MSRWAGNLGLLLVAIIWGTMIPATQIQLDRWDPYFLAAFRSLAAAPLLWLALVWRERGAGRAGSVHAGRLWLVGLVGSGGFALLYALGVQFADPVLAAILGATSPAVAAVTDRLFFGLAFDRRMVPAILCSVLGCALATVDFSAAGKGITFGGGEAMILGAIVCWSWYSTAAQRWCTGWSQLRITLVTVTIGGIGLVGAYFVAVLFGVAQLPPAAPQRWQETASLGWYVVMVMALGVLLWNSGVKAVGVVVASLYINLTPIVAILILVLLGATARPVQLLGGALVIAGIAFSEWRMLRDKRAAA